MKTFYILLMLVLSPNTMAQTNLIKTKTSPIETKLSEISNSDYKFHFRYIVGYQCIDIFSNDSTSFQGTLLNQIREYKSKDDQHFSHYVYEMLELDSNLTTDIGKLIFQKNYIKIPTGDSIKNWPHLFFNCSCPIIHLLFKKNEQTSVKKYNCLEGQNDSIQYVLTLKELDIKIKQTFQLQKHYEAFRNKLEKGKLYHDGYWGMYKFTDEESAFLKKDKPRRDYLYSIRDTITNHLSNKLNQLIQNTDRLECYGDFEVIFSKKGKVDKILFSEPSDKTDKKCGRIIKKALRKVSFDFIAPKYKFSRSISFWNNKVEVYDRTVY